ncbi:MAG: MFS transporter [Verrucomicrobia bacterium]|nr:MFS transporter [Verrucomicrobiota bacterium]MBI3867342.1 MFS transporter [Verrucomicrobiota bacterium]
MTQPPEKRNAKYERWRWQIFGITWLAYASYYLTRKAFSVAKNELKRPEVLGLTKGQMSWMDGSYSAAYAFGQFFWGTLGDRLGTRKVVLFGMMSSLVTCFAMGMSGSVLLMGVLFTLQGLWQSSGWAPLAKNMGEFFSQRERGSIMGFWCTNYALGGFIATIVASKAAHYWGWRGAFVVPAACLLGAWILFFLFQRNRPEDVGLPPIEEYHSEEAPAAPAPDAKAKPAPPEAASWATVRMVLATPMVWVLAISYFLIKPTRYLFLFWSPVYISERLGTDTDVSGRLSSLFDLGGPLGSLTGGLVSDRLFSSKRIPISVLALFSLAALVVVLPFLPFTHMGMGAAMFAVGFLIFIPDSLISGTAAIDFGTKRGASTANGLINGTGSVGQMVGVGLPGMVQYYVGEGHDIWRAIFVGLGVSLAVAGCILLPVWNRVPSPPARN